MARRTLIILSVLTALFGCDFSNQVKETVDNDIKDAKVAMGLDISKAKSDFTESYHQALREIKDSNFLEKVTDLYSNITKTSNYIDSLRVEMDKLNNLDTRNVEVVTDMFLHRGTGEMVFTKVKQSYSIAIEVAFPDTTKIRLRKVHETFSEEAKQDLFGLSSPLGVNMILYGIESELIKDGFWCLAGHRMKNYR